jgi:hypothetical protein
MMLYISEQGSPICSEEDNEELPGRGPYKMYTSRLFIYISSVAVVDLQLHVQSVHITTKVVSLNPTRDKVYSIQNYVIKFIGDLRQSLLVTCDRLGIASLLS